MGKVYVWGFRADRAAKESEFCLKILREDTFHLQTGCYPLYSFFALNSECQDIALRACFLFGGHVIGRLF